MTQRSLPERWVIDALAGIELELSASTVPFDREGFVEWHISGSVLLDPDQAVMVTREPQTVTQLHGDPEFDRLTVFTMSGLTINLLDVDVLDALDEHSADAAAMSPLFDANGDFSDVVRERLDGFGGGYSFVFLDRAWVVPAWRGFGIGRVLTDKAIAMVTEPPVSVVGVLSHPYEDWNEEHPDPPPDAIARTDHVWESLGFVRIVDQLFVRDESFVHPYADERARALGLSGE